MAHKTLPTHAHCMIPITYSTCSSTVLFVCWQWFMNHPVYTFLCASETKHIFLGYLLSYLLYDPDRGKRLPLHSTAPFQNYSSNKSYHGLQQLIVYALKA